MNEAVLVGIVAQGKDGVSWGLMRQPPPYASRLLPGRNAGPMPLGLLISGEQLSISHFLEKIF